MLYPPKKGGTNNKISPCKREPSIVGNLPIYQYSPVFQGYGSNVAAACQ